MKLKASLYYILILSIAIMHVIAKADTNKQKKFLDYIGNMESLEADYKQDVTGRKGTIISSNKGHFMFKSPNLFRMQSPGNSLTINDGNYLWQFEPELEQVIKTKISGDDHALTAMSIINNIKSIEENYNIKAEKRVYRGTKYCLTDKTNPKKLVDISEPKKYNTFTKKTS